MPRYSWNRKIFWSETAISQQHRLPHNGHPLVSLEAEIPNLTWTCELNLSALPYLIDHKVAGSVLFPGAGYVELGLAMARQLLSSNTDEIDRGVTLENVKFIAPTSLLEDQYSSLYIVADGDHQTFSISSQTDDQQAFISAKGQFFSGSGKASEVESIPSIDGDDRFHTSWEPEILYAKLKTRGLEYSKYFRAVKRIRINENEVFAHLSLPEALSSNGYLLHPVMLDAAMHSLIAIDFVRGDDTSELLPVAIDKVQWFGNASDNLVAYGRIHSRQRNLIVGDLRIYNNDDNLVADLTGIRCQVISSDPRKHLTKMESWIYEKNWKQTKPKSVPVSQDNFWLLLGNIQGEIPKNTFQIPDNWSVDDLNKYIEHSQRKDLNIIDARFIDSKKEDIPVTDDNLALANKLLDTIKHLRQGVKRYCIMTRSGEKILASDILELRFSALTGVAKTAMSEFPQLNITLCDCDPDKKIIDVMNTLAQFENEHELAIRGNNVFICRLERSEFEEVSEEIPKLASCKVESFEIIQRQNARIDTLEYQQCEKPKISNNEVEIAVAYSSLHFKDLMKAMGILSHDAESNTYFEGILGMEGSGTVVSVGSNVRDLKPGDRVYSRGSFLRSHIITDASRVLRLLDNISLIDGSHMVTYMTVYHSLVTIARVKAGETLLIHSAAGGVGLAAISLAKKLGMNIIATAGSEAKRSYLNEIGIEKVCDSRSLEFVNKVHSWTQGRGVDVVINFTPGEIMKKSVDCLAPFGRFIELGKISADRNEALQLKPFNENLIFASVDFDRVINTQPLYVKEIAQLILQWLSEGLISPAPCKVFKASQTIDAFSYMARAQHIGKIAIDLNDSDLKIQAAKDSALFSDKASYIITGGTSGFGLDVAQWMAENSAGNIILLSRNGARTTEAKNAISLMEKSGASVYAPCIDVADEEQIKEIIQKYNTLDKPVKGIIHAAMVLDDRPLQEVDSTSMRKVFNPKGKGAWLLHEYSKNLNLDFFVLFSSISSLVGNAGQTNYVAANYFLDQLAIYRKSQGLPALSINWGVFQDTGVVARNGQLAGHLNAIGIRGFSSQEAKLALAEALKGTKSQIGIMDIDWRSFSEMSGDDIPNPRYESLIEQSKTSLSSTLDPVLQATFQNLDGQNRQQLIASALSETLAKVMRIEANEILPSHNLRDLGLDSLMATETTQEFRQKTGIKIPMMELTTAPSIGTLNERILRIVNEQLPLEEVSESMT